MIAITVIVLLSGLAASITALVKSAQRAIESGEV